MVFRRRKKEKDEVDDRLEEMLGDLDTEEESPTEESSDSDDDALMDMDEDADDNPPSASYLFADMNEPSDEPPRTGSLLAVDFGSVNTRVVLVDLVDGEYRLVARSNGFTTLGYPHADVTVGLYRIIQDLADLTGRRFYDDDQSLIMPESDDRSGVDYFLSTASAGRPLRTLIVGLLPEVSISSAQRALSSSYIQVVDTMHIRDKLSQEERLNNIILNRPDMILIVGGTDGGAKHKIMEMSKTIRLALMVLDPKSRPIVIYAGNKKNEKEIKKLFDNVTPLLVTSNIRPNMQSENINDLLQSTVRVYANYKQQHDDGFANIADDLATGVQPTGLSYRLVAEFLAKSRNQNVLLMDMGGGSTILAGVYKGEANLLIEPKLGLGISARRLFESVGVDAIRRWIPFEIRAIDLQNYAFNKTLRTSTIPLSRRDWFIEYAFLRAGFEYVQTNTRELWGGINELNIEFGAVDFIIAAGGALTQTGNASMALMLIADMIQPTGLTEVQADPHGLIPAIGSIAQVNTLAALQLLQGNNLENLGTIISFDDNASPKVDETALKLKLTTEDGEEFEHEIAGGHLWHLPLPHTVTIKIEMRCARGLKIEGKRRLTRTLTGGAGGLLFDMRGRSFNPPEEVEERAKWLPLWFGEALGEEPFEIPESWLEPLVEEPLSVTVQAINLEAGTNALFNIGTEADDEFSRLISEDDEEPEEKDDLDDLRDLL